MKNALQAQLLKAGLADSKKIKKANAQQAHAKRTGATTEQDALKAALVQQEQERRQHELEQAAKLKQERDEKAHQERLLAILKANSVAKQDGETAYQFVHDGKIKKLYFGATQYAQIVAGQLLIAHSPYVVDSPYYFIPYPLFERINDLWADAVLVNNRVKGQIDTPEDDPYAAYAIPDDLMW